MDGFSYAFRQDTDEHGRATVRLWIDEAGATPPDGWTVATYPEYREAWIEQTRLRAAYLKAELLASYKTRNG